MASVKKAEILNKNKNDDLPDTGKRVSPCCRLPRENINEAAASTTSTKSPSTSPTKSPSTTKSEEADKEKMKIMKNEKILKNMEEKSFEKVDDHAGGFVDLDNPLTTKSVEKNDNLVGGIIDGVPEGEIPPVVPARSKRIPIVERSSANYYNPTNVAVPRRGSARPAPANLEERPLILATHLVPSLPIALFEIIAEVVEATTGKAVSILHESRVDRPVAKDLVDIAIIPASEDWNEGSLLPVSLVFEHRLNKDNNPAVYADIVVAADCMRNIEEILDLRGYRCALPDRRKALGAAGLLFSHLKSKGENPSFFGNTLDSGSQLAALQMVAGKQAEVGILESPVINCHRNTLRGIGSLSILASLGPLPPYRIMLNKKIEGSLREKIKESLLRVERDEGWMERFKQFGVTGFAEYSEDRYDLDDIKSVVTSVPYY